MKLRAYGSLSDAAGDCRRAADQHVPVDGLHGLARQPDDALDERHARLRARAALRHVPHAGRVEDDHVTAVGIGEPREEARGQDAVALVDRGTHRPGGDAVRLDDVLLHDPGQAQGEHDDHDELGHRRERRLRTTGGREAQLDPLDALLALGRSGHGIG